MGLIFQDNFESGNLTAGGWAGNGSVSNAYHYMEGNYHANIGGFAYILKTFSQSYPYLYCQFLYYSKSDAGHVADILRFRSGGSYIATLYRDANNYFYICQGDRGGTIYGQTVQSYNPNDVQVIDVFYDPDPSDGIFQVKVNGALVIDYRGCTVPNSQKDLDTITFGYSNDYM